MKITVTRDGKRMTAKLPHPQCTYVEVPIACTCGSNKVRGIGIHETTHDTYVADARCCGCDKPSGTIRATVSTIFGIAEDDRVLNGRVRVY